MTILAGPKLVCAAAFAAGFWDIAGSWLAQTAGATTEPGKVETFELSSEVFHNRRSIRVFLPRGYGDAASRNRRYPVLYLNDGFAVFKAGAWNAPEIVERLESEGRMRPIILVGIDNGQVSRTEAPSSAPANTFPTPIRQTSRRSPLRRGLRIRSF